MPSIFARLTGKKVSTGNPSSKPKAKTTTRPKVFVVRASLDAVKSSFVKKNGKKKDELVAYTETDGALARPSTAKKNGEPTVDITNSVMFNGSTLNLSVVDEESYMNFEEKEERDVSKHERSVVIDETSYETPLRDLEEDDPEDEDDEDESLENESSRSPSSSPIFQVMENSVEESTKSAALLDEAEDDEDEDEIEQVQVKEKDQDKIFADSHESLPEPPQMPMEVAKAPVEEQISEALVVVEKVTPTPTTLETMEVAPAPKVQEVVIVKPVAVTSKPEIFETLKRNNIAARSQSSAVGNLRAKFENGSTKPPPALRVVLQAHNNKTQKPVLKPLVFPESVSFLPEAQEPVKPVVQAKLPVVFQEAPKPSVIAKQEVVTVNAVKPAAALTERTISIASGDEKQLMAAMLEIAAKPYKEQSVWFLNACWKQQFELNVEQRERVWAFCHKFIELDPVGDKGCELDELRAHRVLEVLAEALTFQEMRTKFHVRFRHVSLIETLIFVFGADWTQVVIAPQGAEGAQEQMQQAQLLMTKSADALTSCQETAKVASEDEKRSQETAKLALESKEQAISSEQSAISAETRAIGAEAEATARAEEARVALESAIEAAAVAKAAEAESAAKVEQSAQFEAESKRGHEQAVVAENKAVDDEQRAREAESDAFRNEESAKVSEIKAMEAEKSLIEGQTRVEAALFKVKEEETAFQKLLEDLKRKSEDESFGIVARRKANHEREMLLAKDPDPLTRARIAEEAVVRKHEKLIKSASVARASASTARVESEKSRARAVQSRAAAENTRTDAAVRKSAAETKAFAAVDARKVCEEAKEVASRAVEQARLCQETSDHAFANAKQAQESATEARIAAAQVKQESVVCRMSAEQDETKAVAAQKAAEASRETAEVAVSEAVQAFERARLFVERVSKQASAGQGGWWWASREIEEIKRFVPQKMLKKLEQQQLMT